MKATVQKQPFLRIVPVMLALAMVVGSVLMPLSVSAAPTEQMGMSNMQGSGQYHIVRHGETLSGIAVQYGTSVYAIMQANGLKDPNRIYSGQRLLIPSGSGGMWGGGMNDDRDGMAGGNMPAGKTSGGTMHGDKGGKEEVHCKAYHTVMYGETALEIAMHYQVSTYSLAKANDMSDANAILEGQKLCIPVGPAPINPPTTEVPKRDNPKPKPPTAEHPMKPVPPTEPKPPTAEHPMKPVPPTEPKPPTAEHPMEPMPPTGSMPPNPAHPAEPMPPMGDGCQAHRVQKGETLAQIAYYYGTSIHALMKLNGITDPNKIYAGQVLKINCGDMGWMSEPMPESMPMAGQAQMAEPMPPAQPMPAAQPMGQAPVAEPMPMREPMAMAGQAPMTEPMPVAQARPMAEPMPMREPMPAAHSRPMPEPMPMAGQAQMAEPMPMGNQGMPPQQPMSGYVEASHSKPMPMPEPHKGMSLRPQETWRGTYYSTKYLSGDPVFVRDDYDVRFNWYGNSPGKDVPEDRFSVRWERNVHFDGGTYHFTATVDDGVRVYVGDKLVIDAWLEQPVTTYTADVQPPAGVHKVVVEYFEEANMASVDVGWEKSMSMHHW